MHCFMKKSAGRIILEPHSNSGFEPLRHCRAAVSGVSELGSRGCLCGGRSALRDFSVLVEREQVTRFEFDRNSLGTPHRGSVTFDILEDPCPLTVSALVPDCNSNGVADECDISSSVSLDQDFDGIPDECQGERFRRGDADVSGEVDFTDAIAQLEHLFLGRGVLLCDDAVDSNDDGLTDFSDAIHTLTVLFLGGFIPASGKDRCGTDPTPDALDCAFYSATCD